MAENSKKVAFIVAFEGYEPTEYTVPKKVLEKAGFQVVTASIKAGFAVAKDGSTTKVDKLVAQLNPADYEALVVVGGPGVPDDLETNAVYEVVQKFNMAGKRLAGICHGTRVLANAGALVTVNATGWNGDGKLPAIFDKHAAIFMDVPVVVDDRTKIVTARGPHEAEAFGHAILKVI